MSAFERTLKQHLVSYRIVSYIAYLEVRLGSSPAYFAECFDGLFEQGGDETNTEADQHQQQPTVELQTSVEPATSANQPHYC